MRNKKVAKDALRNEAEEKIARDPIAPDNPQPGEELQHRLLHELQVHQVELKMQNDELRQAQIAMEESRDRYVDLYDFAPIGYLTLSRAGTISEINLTAADMLGIVRSQLVSRRFSQFVVKEDRDRWDKYFINVMQHSQRLRCEVTLQRGDDSCFHAQMDSVNCCELEKSSSLDAKQDWVSVVRLALSDISERMQSETDLHNARGLAENIVDTVHEPLLVLDSASKVVSASMAFFDQFRVTPEETLGHHIYEVGQRRWDIPRLRELLETILPYGQFLDGYAIEHDFPDIGKRKLLLNARRITGKADATQAILLAINDVTERM
ncbi:MAG: PAS domain-containing protein [Sideroxyarcus sp.]